VQLPDVQTQVYGQPYQTPDGATVITVSRVRGREESVFASPLGVFVIRDGKPAWEPAVDAGRIALIGVLTGLVAALLATAAVLRRPPWPDMSIVEQR
jgi:hypothetical protein